MTDAVRDLYQRSTGALPALFALCLMAGAAPTAHAQGGGMPTPAELERAKTFVAPKVGDYAAKLAQQPDLMGQWNPVAPNNRAGGPFFDPSDLFVSFQSVPGEQGFGPNAGSYMKNVPYKPEYKKKYMELVKETTEGKSRDDFASCVPYGMPRFLGGAAGPNDIIQSPEVIIWHNTYGRAIRRIFLDGRKHPSPDGPEGTDARTLTGHSVGHWEGDTLVVETVNMLANYYDESPAPHSDQVSLIERIRLIGPNLMEDQITITDPVMLERPWVVTRYHRRGGVPFGPALPGDPPGGVPGGPPPGGDTIVHRFLDVNDRPCVANVEMRDGFQHMLLPQELEAAKAKTGAPAKKAPAKGKVAVKKETKR